MVALLGPNGAGKTPTIEILEGFRAIAAYFEVPTEVIFSTEPFPRLGSASAEGASAS